MAALLASTVANWLSVRLTCAVLTGVKKKKRHHSDQAEKFRIYKIGEVD